MGDVRSIHSASRYPVGRLIRDSRVARGLTQEEAAEVAGVSVGAWRSAERGTRRPRPHTFAAILDVLDLSVEEIHQAMPSTAEVQAARQELIELCDEELPDDAVVTVLDLVRLLSGH